MESESFSVLNLVCAAFFMMCTVVFFYYLYLTIKSYMKCKSDTKEDIPCPNTCNPGYECKQVETVPDFVIGEVVQEDVSEEVIQEETSELLEAPAVTEVVGDVPAEI